MNRRALLLVLMLLVGLILRLVGAWFSIGFWHPDEHFQILEFASFKLGQLAPEKLMWEFREQIRPWLQPAIAVAAAKILGWEELDRSFDLARLLRLLSALLTFGATGAYLAALRRRFERPWMFLLCAYAMLCLFLVPVLEVRFSSENWSMAFMMLGLAALLAYKGEAPSRGREAGMAIAAGLLFGLACVARFQACLMIGPGLAAFLVARKITARTLGWIALGGAAALAAGVAIDAWGYGELVLSQVNYVKINFFEGKANAFGVMPWWDYFRTYLTELTFPAGFLVFLAGIAGPLLLLRDPLAWFFLPNLAIHFLLQHKEQRFLFPHLFLALPLFFLALEKLGPWKALPRRTRIVSAAVIAGAIAWNTILSVPAAISPIESGVALLEHVHARGLSGTRLSFDGPAPNAAGGVLQYNVYALPSDLAFVQHRLQREAMQVVAEEGAPLYRTIARHRAMPERIASDGAVCELAWETSPAAFMRLFPPLERSPGLVLVRPRQRFLYRCDPR